MSGHLGSLLMTKSLYIFARYCQIMKFVVSNLLMKLLLLVRGYFRFEHFT